MSAATKQRLCAFSHDKVLVTGAGAVLGQGIVKALRCSELDLVIAAADPNPLSPALFWVERGYIIPPVIDPNFIRRFSDVLDLERPDVVWLALTWSYLVGQASRGA